MPDKITGVAPAAGAGLSGSELAVKEIRRGDLMLDRRRAVRSVSKHWSYRRAGQYQEMMQFIAECPELREHHGPVPTGYYHWRITAPSQ